MLRAFQFVFVAAVLFATCAIAQAEYIPILYNNTDSLDVLKDNFEGQALGYFANETTVSAPVGTWTGHNYWAVNDAVRIANAAEAGFTTDEGEKMLSVRKASHTSTILGTGVAANSGTGDLITFTIAFHRAGGAGDQVSLYMRDSSNVVLTQIGVNATAIGITNSAGSWQWLTQTATSGVWNTLVVQHTNGTNIWSLSVNGQTPEIKTSSNNLGNWSRIFMQNDNYPGGMYFDAVTAPVPEPSTLALLAGGLIGLLCYAWRKRR